MADLLKLQNGSDVRGIALEGVADEHVNLTPDIAKQIGCAFVSWLEKKSGVNANALIIGVGRDSRVSGPDLAMGLIQGIVSAGAKVVDCGMATTPAMFMSIVFPATQFHGSAMITASHLPFNRNGIKFFDADGGLEHDDITEILKLAGMLNPQHVNYFPEPVDLLTLYADHLREAIIQGINSDSDKPLEGLKIVVDSGNGASGFFVDKILKPLGADTTGSQFLEPDGMFPNHIPNPENKQAMEAIRNAVLNNKADLGLIFDTDVDRMSAVLSDGSEVNRDAIIAMAAAILAPENPGSTIITDSVTSDRLTYFLEDVLGLKHLCYMRGYKNVINKQKELNAAGTNAPLAMETSGHGALKENYYLDDGAYLAVKLVIALAKARAEGKKLDSLIEKLPPLVEEGEYRFKIKDENFKDYGKSVLKEFKARAEKAGYKMPESYEGVRISFKEGDAQGWMLLRLSLHDPVMPLNIEGARKGDVAKIKAIAKELLAGFDKLDMSCLD
ncbi:MAG: phosphomannomutase/phosphoglucomutase [Treponema sp.]|uniref:phosphomannomutase/phosphoglucomutase n=1 Tax=Treponema sp. TaxID=166 RepID=UPI001E00DD5D|nr:phosphomannomutase/phosphoglucomutase [Treponema sp.]MBS7311012.1 phosphomannomutase/phosphoglucomutase [Treponema sp.]MCI5697307.1 phosphomannomutase/phosphoglucomutase [Spirochaetia bacterium]